MAGSRTPPAGKDRNTEARETPCELGSPVCFSNFRKHEAVTDVLQRSTVAGQALKRATLARSDHYPKVREVS